MHSATSDGLRCYGNLTLETSGGATSNSPGTVNIDTTGAINNVSHGLYVTGSLTATSGNLSASSGDADKTYGIEAGSDVVIKNAGISATGGGDTSASTSYGIYTPKSISVGVSNGTTTDSSLTATSGSASGNAVAVGAGSAESGASSAAAFTVLSGTVTATSNYGGAQSVGIMCGSFVAKGGEINIESAAGDDASGKAFGLYCKGDCTFGTKENSLLTDDTVLNITNNDSTDVNVGLYLIGGATYTFNQLSGTINSTSGNSSRSISSGTTIVSLNQYATLGACFTTSSNLFQGLLTCSAGKATSSGYSAGALFTANLEFQKIYATFNGSDSAYGSSFGMVDSCSSGTLKFTSGTVNATAGDAVGYSVGILASSTTTVTSANVYCYGAASSMSTSLGTTTATSGLLTTTGTFTISGGSLSAYAGEFTGSASAAGWPVSGLCSNGDFYINGGSVVAQSGFSAVTGTNSYGLRTIGGKLYVNGGELVAKSTDGVYCGVGIASPTGINITGGYVYGYGGPASAGSEGIRYFASELSITGGTVEAEAAESTAGYSYGIYGMVANSSLVVSGTAEVTVKSSSASGRSAGINEDGSVTVSNGTLDVVGGNSNSDIAYGAYVGGVLTVSGGTTNITSGTAGSTSAQGIIGLSVAGSTYNEGTTTLTGGTLNVTTLSSEIDANVYNYGIQLTDKNVGFGGTNVTVECGSSSGTAENINCIGINCPTSGGSAYFLKGTVKVTSGSSGYYSYAIYCTSNCFLQGADVNVKGGQARMRSAGS